MKTYTMFVHADKKNKRIDAQALPTPPIESDLTFGKWTRRMVSTRATITVIGTGDRLSNVALVVLATSLVAGKWEVISGSRKVQK